MKAAGVPFETDDGVFDFHCLRVSYVTNLVKSGANPKIVQTLARHSTIVLTMDLYAKQDTKEAADALLRSCLQSADAVEGLEQSSGARVVVATGRARVP